MSSRTAAPLTVQLYCEMLPPRALLAPPFRDVPDPVLGRVRAVLARAAGRPVRLELVLRVTMTGDARAPLADGALEVAHALLAEPRAFGLDAARLWPQLRGDEGVWLSAFTQARYFARLEPLLAEHFVAASGPGMPALLYDLEPPRDVLDALLGRRGRAQARTELAALARRMARSAPVPLFDDAARSLAEHVGRLRDLEPARAAPPGSPPWQPRHTAAVVPAGSGWLRSRAERALMTPTRAPRRGAPIFDGLEAMCYGSLVGYVVPGAVPGLRAACGAAVVAATARSHVRYCRAQGVAAGVLLGCTGVGLLGDEPVYRSPGALAQAARAAGVARLERIGVYNLRGLLFGARDPQHHGLREDWPAWVAAVTGQTVSATSLSSSSSSSGSQIEISSKLSTMRE